MRQALLQVNGRPGGRAANERAGDVSGQPGTWAATSALRAT